MESMTAGGKTVKWTLQPQYNGVPGSLPVSSGSISGTGGWIRSNAVKQLPMAEAKNCYVLLLTLPLQGTGNASFRNIVVTESKIR